MEMPPVRKKELGVGSEMKKILKKGMAIFSVMVNIISIGSIAIALIIANKRSASSESEIADSLSVKYASEDALIMVSEPNATSFIFKVKRENVDSSFCKYHIDKQDVLLLESGALIATFFLKNDPISPIRLLLRRHGSGDMFSSGHILLESDENCFFVPLTDTKVIMQ